MNLQQQINNVEDELFEIILKHLEENKIAVDKAQELAREFLAVLPIASQQDLLHKLQALSDTYPEAKEVYNDELSKTFTQKDKEVLARMRDAIQQGKMEHAINIAKNMK